ncbi:MAG: phosphoesterase, partial [Alphaproteobacteria bacterium]|nr:phosphoesterase [Alphaproteobacteria bacterium]
MTKHLLLAGLAVAAVAAGATGAAAREDYVADIHVVAGSGEPADTVTGVVFEDANRDGMRQEGETGIEGVMVSNGREVVATDADGAYSLPAYDNMTVFVTEPADHDAPINENLVPQVFYHHLPEGTPEDLRYGGLPPTGPLPAAINFPLIPAEPADAFSCVV